MTALVEDSPADIKHSDEEHGHPEDGVTVAHTVILNRFLGLPVSDMGQSVWRGLSNAPVASSVTLT